MRLDEIIALAHEYVNSESARLATIDQCARDEAMWTLVDIASHAIATRAMLATAISDLLAGPGDECGFERPVVTVTGDVWVPPSWTACVSPDDAEAMARMLLVSAAAARKSNDRS